MYFSAPSANNIHRRNTAEIKQMLQTASKLLKTSGSTAAQIPANFSQPPSFFIGFSAADSAIRPEDSFN